MTALGDWLDGLPRMLTTTAAGNLRTYRRVGGSNGNQTDRPRLIVIHTMETPEDNRAQSTARWVQAGGGTSKVSCHFCVDNDEAIRCVLDEHVAFTQLTPWNDMSLSIEQSGRAASTAGEWQDPYSVGQRALVAKIVAAWSERWIIPLRFVGVDELVDWRNCTGVTTHYQLSLASQRQELLSLGYKPGNHWDPGPNYPMDQMLAEAAAHLVTPPITPPTEDEDDMRAWQDKRFKNVFHAATGLCCAPAEVPGLVISVEDPGHDPKLAACCRASWGIEGSSPSEVVQIATARGYLLPS